MNKGFIRNSGGLTPLRNGVSIAAILIASVYSSASVAQTEPSSAAESADTQEIVVTGSRIVRPATDLPTPVNVVGADTLENNDAQFDIGRALAQQPAIGFTGTMQQNQQSGAAGTRGEATGGLSLVDLRSLGANRTLVLVNGKRRVAGTTDSAAVDLNSINPALIDRVEVITGGASAIYGSDAVSGVVNIITKNDFQGLRLSLDGSRPTESSEGLTWGGNILAGKNFDDNRGNITLAFNYAKVKAISARHADMHNYDLFNNPANTGPNDGIPDRILLPGSESYRYSGYGIVGVRGETGPLGVYMFNDDGTPRRPPTALYSDGSLFGIYENCGQACFRYDDSIQIIPDIERYNINGSAHYDISDSVEAYLDLGYNHTSSKGVGQPAIQSAIPINVADNAFIDPTFQQQLLGAGVTTLLMDRGFTDVGLRSSEVNRHSFTASGGFRGTLKTGLSNLKYDVYSTYGRTEAKMIGYNRLILANYKAAFDSVIDPTDGTAKCRMDVPALQGAGYVQPNIYGDAPCSPFNPFGSTASSEAARDFVRGTTVSNAFVEQFVAGASISGDTSQFLTMPGGGAIGIAIGAEYRKERNGRTNDILLRNGLTSQAASQDYSGGFHVSEFFAELSVPLLTDMPFAKLLSFEGAVRQASYSHSSSVTSWKLGGMWEPTDGLRFRGTMGRAVRAPNIFEAFRPTEGQTTNINDPCSQNNLSLNPNRATNCATLGRPDGFVPVNGGVGIQFAVSGNQNLRPETSDSWTVGTIISPSALPGLSISLDWYNIKIKDAISFVSGQDIANNCVDRAGGPDPDLCPLLTRETDPTSPNYFAIISGRSTYVNTSKLQTSGLDAQIAYNQALGAGRLSTALSLTYLHRFRTFTFQSRPDQYRVYEGYLGFPRYKAIAQINYDIGSWKIGWQGRYQSSQSLLDQSPGLSQELSTPRKTGAKFYNDVSLAYSFELASRHQAKISLGATNILNVKLPKMEGTQAISATAGGFDQFGPVVRAGFEITF